jgi:hypothetical protein
VHPPAGPQRGCTLHGKPDISLANKTGQLDVLPTGKDRRKRQENVAAK